MTDPVAQLRAVHSTLLDVLPDARSIQDEGSGKHRLALGIMAAETASAKGTEGGCVQATTALAAVQDEAADLDDSHSAHVKRCAKVAEQAYAALKRIDWRAVPPAVVLTVRGFGDVPISATDPVTAIAALLLSVPATAALTVTVTVDGLAATDLMDGKLTFPVQIPAGKTTAPVPFIFAAQELAANKHGDVVLAPPAGVKLGAPGGFSFTLKGNAGTPRGKLTFPKPIGTVLREAGGETTVEVQVERQNVSTHLAATIPVVDIVLPAAILKAVGPAVFKEGSKYGYAPMVLHPYGAGARSSAVRRTAGKANLKATPDFDLGAVANQDFVVQDGQDVVTGGNPFHDRCPAEALAVLGFPFGWSMNWSPDDVAAWVALTGRRPYVCSGGSHNGKRITTWDACMGGPGGQLDWHGTNFATALAVIPRGGGLLVPTWWMSPDQGRGSYASLAGSQQYRDRAASFGRAACAMMVAAGKEPGQLSPRWDKEVNQHKTRSPKSPDEVLEYAAAQATFLQGFDEGYTVTQPVKPLHILGLARHAQIGPIENWIPKGPDGKALIGGVDISAHLPDDGNGLSGHPVAEQAAVTRQWLRGGYDGRPCYSHDHADPRYSGKVVCQKYGLAMIHSETSARNEPGMACTISAGFWLGMFGFWKENAKMMGPVGVFATSAIKPSPIPGWGDGIAMLGRCAKGQAS